MRWFRDELFGHGSHRIILQEMLDKTYLTGFATILLVALRCRSSISRLGKSSPDTAHYTFVRDVADSSASQTVIWGVLC
jgi:hypothetical protein